MNFHSNICVFLSNKKKKNVEKTNKPFMIITKINSYSNKAISLSNKITKIPQYSLFFLPFHSVERTIDGQFYVLKMDAKGNDYISFDHFFLSGNKTLREKMGQAICSYYYLLQTLQRINTYNMNDMNLSTDTIVFDPRNKTPRLLISFSQQSNESNESNASVCVLNNIYKHLLIHLQREKKNDLFIPQTEHEPNHCHHFFTIFSHFLDETRETDPVLAYKELENRFNHLF